MKNFFGALGAVLSAFIGIRKRDSHLQTLRPVHYIVAGVTAVAGFVFLLLAVVRAVV